MLVLPAQFLQRGIRVYRKAEQEQVVSPELSVGDEEVAAH